jgi:ABC-type sugar transport system permease subunit
MKREPPGIAPLAALITRFQHITLPLLVPILVVILVLHTSFAFVVFEEVLAITQGGPGDATWVAVWYSYKRSFAPPFGSANRRNSLAPW